MRLRLQNAMVARGCHVSGALTAPGAVWSMQSTSVVMGCSGILRALA